MTMIEIDNLTHDYVTGILQRRRWRALDGVSLSVQRGEVLGLLGPNGAGKTTLFKALLGLIRPTAGRLCVEGRDACRIEWKGRLGYLPEQPSFYEHLTAHELLLYSGLLSGLDRTEAARRATHLLDEVSLAGAARWPLRKFSKGMQQRIGLAQALISNPTILLLDEPMSGLDPLGRKLVLETIRARRKAGATIIFSSHNLADVEVLADRVVLLAEGRMVDSGTVASLIHPRQAGLEVVVAGIAAPQLESLRNLATRIEATGDGASIYLSDDQRLTELITILHAAGGHLISVNPLQSSLEDWFLERVQAGNPPEFAD